MPVTNTNSITFSYQRDTIPIPFMDSELDEENMQQEDEEISRNLIPFMESELDMTLDGGYEAHLRQDEDGDDQILDNTQQDEELLHSLVSFMNGGGDFDEFLSNGVANGDFSINIE
mmetsp:Transcript_13459/g.16023  ORF Transcript_13459/g.16023 Transcript_13459/m.16023 type:complete len:116 (-) Transcript_13459:121-468(-)|eukprot:CAMPEP_0114348346 /NCGR_PEP_ID=MMETSP0101-20121206/14626_1 /TAXON_ID=38822 ORGANISM="Pteridomonas danica, Strain PT" /NCGR_SAMPLE_ID=MMETSP0101 /ASSEMBLY_ACC=CAM_ASM_000211 /LENGTH=115 /DNA_ID=CAMNT_0001486199 /DNA_START=233 /DNA_END=580 /DNA_ORIENTATION=+